MEREQNVSILVMLSSGSQNYVNEVCFKFWLMIFMNATGVGLAWSVREGSRKFTKQTNKPTAFSFIRISCILFVMQYTGLWLLKATSQCIEPQQRQRQYQRPRQRRQAEVAATTVAMELNFGM